MCEQKPIHYRQGLKSEVTTGTKQAQAQWQCLYVHISYLLNACVLFIYGFGAADLNGTKSEYY